MCQIPGLVHSARTMITCTPWYPCWIFNECGFGSRLVTELAPCQRRTLNQQFASPTDRRQRVRIIGVCDPHQSSNTTANYTRMIVPLDIWRTNAVGRACCWTIHVALIGPPIAPLLLSSRVRRRRQVAQTFHIFRVKITRNRRRKASLVRVQGLNRS